VTGSNPSTGTNAPITLELVCFAENEENSVQLGVGAPLKRRIKWIIYVAQSRHGLQIKDADLIGVPVCIQTDIHIVINMLSVQNVVIKFFIHFGVIYIK
jgi:hypothetical protein